MTIVIIFNVFILFCNFFTFFGWPHSQLKHTKATYSEYFWQKRVTAIHAESYYVLLHLHTRTHLHFQFLKRVRSLRAYVPQSSENIARYNVDELKQWQLLSSNCRRVVPTV